MNLRFTFLCLLLFYFRILSSQRLTEDNSKLAQNIDSIIQQKIKETGIIGMAAAVIIDKKVFWSKGFGYADLENQIAFTPATVMNIGSISKTFTGFCIMKAAEQGKLTLDEDINKYLPFRIINPFHPNDKITLRQLATHTSGLADRYPFYTDSIYFNIGKKTTDLGKFLKEYFVKGGKYYSDQNFINAKSGTVREYSNIGAGLAGYIIELKTGMKLSKYAKKFIYKPLKMKSTAWSIHDVDLKKHTRLYKRNGEVINSIPLYDLITYPDGGVRTTVEDLSKFYISILDNGTYNGKRILGKSFAEEMIRFQFTEMNKPENVEIKKSNSGIFWTTKINGSRIGHNGSDPGIRTFMLSDLSKEIGVILFFNTELSEEEDVKFFEIYQTLHHFGELCKERISD